MASDDGGRAWRPTVFGSRNEPVDASPSTRSCRSASGRRARGRIAASDDLGPVGIPRTFLPELEYESSRHRSGRDGNNARPHNASGHLPKRATPEGLGSSQGTQPSRSISRRGHSPETRATRGVIYISYSLVPYAESGDGREGSNLWFPSRSRRALPADSRFVCSSCSGVVLPRGTCRAGAPSRIRRADLRLAACQASDASDGRSDTASNP